MEGQNLATISQTVSLPVSVAEAVQQWHDYQELTQKLLDESDYQHIGNKKYKKKSAWRKYGRAFNISTEVTYREIVRAQDGYPIFARIEIRATAQNGRTEEADHECHVTEKCCAAARSQHCNKAGRKDHNCCQAGCDGRIHWSHPGDLPATALTRAKNRAISDLIGAGEVSAEEMEGQRTTEDTGETAGAAKATDAKVYCSKHPTEVVTEKTNKKTGEKFWSHNLPDGKYCNAGPVPIHAREQPAQGMTPSEDVIDAAFEEMKSAVEPEPVKSAAPVQKVGSAPVLTKAQVIERYCFRYKQAQELGIDVEARDLQAMTIEQLNQAGKELLYKIDLALKVEPH